MNDFLGAITVNAAALVTIITALTLLIKTSGRFSKWAATKIVKSVDFNKLDLCVARCGYEANTHAILEKLKGLDNIRLTVKRLEYLSMRNNNPDDEASISAIYDEYKRLGGNSYIDMNYEKWAKEHRQAYPKRKAGK